MSDKKIEQEAESQAIAIDNQNTENEEKCGGSVQKSQEEQSEQSGQNIDIKKIKKEDKKNEKQGRKKKDKKDENKCNFFELFRYATCYDKSWMIIGSICAFINGLSLPAFSFVLGKLVDGFGPDQTDDEMVDQAFEQFMYFLGIAGISFFLSWGQMYSFMNSGEKQSIRFRIEYFKAILRQDISWFDQIDPNQLSMKIATETFAIQGAICEKIPTFIQTLSTVLGGFVVGYLYGWELALILTAVIPFLGLAATIFTFLIQNAEASVADTYTDAGGKAEQAMFGIKTVKSLNGQEHEQKRYLKSLIWAYKKAYKDGIKIGLGLGFLFFLMIGINALGFYVGSEFIQNERNNSIEDRPYSVGDVLIVFFAIMIGGMNIGQTTPCLKNFALGQQAGYKILKVINAKPKIGPSLHKGETIKNVKGEISFNDVEFTYPTKQDVQVLKKINLTIQPGKKTALVGESGCGKSTCMQLVERFYDADKGSVTVDGVDIKKLNLAWYRENVGYVGQEPVLFAGSIRENMRYGKPDATEEEMIQALKHARAWDFVNQMSDKLDTLVGNSGGQLSGGQKQRICIARAILKSPPILLLDEATSALDRQNEKSIQKTLDEVSTGRTTIVIAHRLSTIKNSDQILLIDKGKVLEQGTHDELIKQKGKYYSLSKNQQKSEEEDEEEQEQEEEQEKEEEEEEEKQQSEQNSQIEKADDFKEKKDRQLLNKEANTSNSSKFWYKSAKIKHPKQTSSVLKAQGNKEKDINQQNKEKQENLESKKNSKNLENNKNQEKNEENEEKLSLKQKKNVVKELLKINKQEWPFMLVGTFASSVVGAVHPVSGILLGKLIFVLSTYGTFVYDKEEYESDRDLYCILYLVLALGAGVGSLLQMASWRKVGEGLTFKLRKKAFAKILKMRPDWFDFEENSAGVLSSRLGSDTQIVNGLASNVLNVQISNVSSFVVGVVVAAYYEWRICLIALFFFPFIAVSGMVQAAFIQGFGDKTDEAYKSSGNLVQEAVVNMRTVNSFGNEKFIQKTYEGRLEGPRSIITEKAMKTGISFGVSQFIMFFVMGLLFYIGALLVRDVGIEVEGMYIGLFAIINAAMGVGNNNQFMTDLGQAFNAASSLFNIYENEDEEQYNSKMCPNPIKIEQMAEFKGHIKFKNVYFKYPTRNKYVLNGISFEIKPGQKVAFVGPSGCGKSTVMQILQRFYEIESGTITIDGRNLNEYDIFSLRAQYGVVSQEPVLFNGSIRDNIEYNTPNLTFDEVRHLAKLANAADFIEKDEGEVPQNLDLKEIGRGYDRQVGNKGGSLSGGQKQRIAIARAIAKNPKILFLDEATSALDNENEKKVQASLDQLMKGRTTLAVAHRISTIADSDKIFVFENGHIVEEGNYQELINKKNYFYRLERGDQKK